jgi:T5SS/PEP-CTERM-associated repeat protein
MKLRISGTCVAVTIIMWTALAAQAATAYWKADSGSGDWSDTNKWSTLAVPGISDTASFTLQQSAPFTVSFTADAASKLSLSSTDPAKPLVATFELNGHTLTHTNATLDVQRAVDWTILDGTLWSHTTAGTLNIGYYQGDYVPKVTIGTGATYLYNGTTYLQVGSRSAGELVVQDGGKLVTQPSSGTEALRIGVTTSSADGYTNYTASLSVIGSGSVWSNLLGSILLSTHKLATAELTVTNNGAVVHNGTTLMVGNTTGANASMTVVSGGMVDARLATSYLSIGNNGTGTVTVAGAGSQLLVSTNQNLYLANLANASQGTLIIEDGGLVEKMVGSHNIYIGYKDNATGRVIVRDGGVLRWAGKFGGVVVGSVGSAEGSTGELTVTGATSRVILGEFTVGATRGNALVTVADGGTLEIFRTMYVGRIATNLVSSHNGLAKVVVTGAGSVLKKSALTVAELPDATISATTSLGVGGGGFSGWDNDGLKYYSLGTYGPGGKGEVVVENGGLVDLNGYVAVYSNSTLRIDGGRTQSGYIGIETGAVFNAVLRQGDANGTALMTASTEVRLWGATLAVELGTDFVSVPGDVYTLISGPLHTSINRFSFNGARLQDGDVIQAGGTTFKVGYTANAVTLTARQTGTMIRVL